MRLNQNPSKLRQILRILFGTKEQPVNVMWMRRYDGCAIPEALKVHVTVKDPNSDQCFEIKDIELSMK